MCLCKLFSMLNNSPYNVQMYYLKANFLFFFLFFSVNTLLLLSQLLFFGLRWVKNTRHKKKSIRGNLFLSLAWAKIRLYHERLKASRQRM